MAETAKRERTPDERAARKLAKKARKQAMKAEAAPGTGKPLNEAKKLRKQAKRQKKLAGGTTGAPA